MTKSTASVEIDVDSLIPLVLHSVREQFVIKREKAILFLCPMAHISTM